MENKNIFQEIKQISIDNDHFYITDVSSQEPNHEEFKEHRHDQSIFSLLTKKYNIYSDINMFSFLNLWCLKHSRPLK